MSTKSTFHRSSEDNWRFGESLNFQNFGSQLDANDILNSHFIHRFPKSSLFNRTHGPPLISKNGYSYIKNDSQVFQVMLDCEHFTPEDVNVKIIDDNLVVNAKHADKEDEHGIVAREFTRKYALPNDVDVSNVVCTFRSDGVLTISGPKKAYTKYSGKQRIIPIEMEEMEKNGDVRNGKIDTGTNP